MRYYKMDGGKWLWLDWLVLIGVSSPIKRNLKLIGWSASKMVDFGRELKGVSFMDGATLLGRTTEGKLHGLLKVERTDG